MISRPTLLLNEQQCKKNIADMAEKARNLDLVFRPHFKTHQSHGIGNWFREEGINKITVSSIKMAEYFARDGWDDITVAFPVNILEIDAINKLANKITLNLVLESVETASYLIEHLLAQVNYLIKIDPGYGRTGVAWNDQALIEKLMEVSSDSFALNFIGFLSHAGHTYDARGKDEVLKVHNEYLPRLSELKTQYIQLYPELILSIGDTPSCSIAEEFGLADEIRPGNFVFYDATQLLIGSCREDQICTVIACPIVAIHKDRSSLIIHGGSIHFSTDRLLNERETTLFGLPVEDKENSWGKIIPTAYVSKLSQEHGTVILPSERICNYQIGDIIKIIPVHSCTSSNLMKSYVGLEGRTYDHMEGQF